MCICPSKRLFLSINSRKKTGYLEFSNSIAGFLPNSRNYLNCANFVNVDADLNRNPAVPPKEIEGHLPDDFIRQVIDYIETNCVMTPEDKAAILPEARKAYPK